MEFAVRRPARKYPWVCVVQEDPNGSYAWGVYSQGRVTKARVTGRAASQEEAESAARQAAEACNAMEAPER